MITFSNLSTTAYENFRDAILKEIEGFRSKPYVDTVGHPTIGYGADLRDNTSYSNTIPYLGLSPSEEALFRSTVQQNYPNTAALTAALSNAGLSSVSISQTDAFSVFQLSIPTYENRVNNWLSGIPESSERAVLVSMAYNGLINTGTSPSLRQAVIDNDRAEAWYNIRYDSNGGSSRGPGIANRRYVESQIFKLFSDPSLTLEQLQAMRMFTKHRVKILSEENQFGPSSIAQQKLAAIGVSGTILGIDDELAPVIDALELKFTDLSKTETSIVALLQGAGYSGSLLSPAIEKVLFRPKKVARLLSQKISLMTVLEQKTH
jgi:GH24 family phage-related lysozyme (muramidase)